MPEKLHHPKEDQYLFKAVRARTAEAGAVLDELEAEHARGDGLMHELRHALARDRVGGARGFEAFAAAVDDDLDFHWKHMRKEEDVVDDPLFGPQPGEEFRALFQRIVTRAPAPIGVGAPAPPKR